MKSWKRNVLIAGVLVLACAGVYLNWFYGRSSTDLTKTLDVDKLMGESSLVLSDTNEPAAAAAAAAADGAESFAAMRLSRQTARDEAVALLQETIAYAEGGDISESDAQLQRIVADALAESQIESMVIAKGYADCVAYISQDGISVAVAAPENGLTQDDVSLVADIVLSQTDRKLGDIRIFGIE